ncbi:MAG: SH3 domain-containing protein [Bdellovibrionales bacterium]|nr:SH3 domain-containing protein [Bdellovibrionales bacterium]
MKKSGLLVCFVWIVFSVFLIAISSGDEILPKSEKQKGQSALVGEEGATIYEKPDFDSKILGQVNPETKVRISLKPRPAKSGLGSFYQIKSKTGQIGYVVDTEVIPEFQNLKKGPSGKKNPGYKSAVIEKEKSRSKQDSIYFTRYAGAGLGLLGFTEKFRGTELSDQVVMYNLRFTGPGVLFDGPPLDVNFSFSLNPPQYYDGISRTPASGFFIFTDILLLLPFWEWNHDLIYYGIGPMVTYTKFQVQSTFNYIDSQEFRLGIVGSLGYGHRFKKWIARLDGKYYFETTRYFGYWASVQYEF